MFGLGLMADEVLWQKDSQGLKFLLYDGLGSVIAATDAGGVTVSTLSYDVFGKVFSQSGESIRYGYTGRPMDGTGLQYNRARYYDKAIGRWNRQDDYRGEMSVPASLHRYQYVFNNPVNYSDPSGMIVDESEGNTWQYFLATFTIILQETRHDVNAQGLSKYTAAVAQAKRLRSFGILGAILGTILFTTIDLVGIFLDDQRTLCQFLKIFVVLKLVAASLYFGSAIGAIGVFASSGVLLIGAAITIGAIMNWMRESAFFVIDNELDCYGCRERK